jgi:hypothetical protein
VSVWEASEAPEEDAAYECGAMEVDSRRLATVGVLTPFWDFSCAMQSSR